MQKLHLRQREGRCVEYLDEDGKWKSTGKKDKDEARVWFFSDRKTSYMTFKDFAEDIFTCEEVGSYKYMQMQTNRHNHYEWWESSDGILKRYLLPRFGKMKLEDITAPVIQDWYLSFKGVEKQNLSPATKKKVLNCLSNILQWAVFRGMIQANPVKNVIKIRETNAGRVPYSDEEMTVMFPEDDSKLIQTWGNLMWAVYMMIMRDTGWRPAEVSGLKVEGFIEKYNGVYTTQSVDSFTRSIQNSIKTSDVGYDYKVGLLTEQTARLVKRYIEGMPQNSLMFSVYGKLVTSYNVRKHFRDCMARIGISTEGRPPYALRTTFMTNVSKKMSREQVEELMGHKQWRSCYDKRTPEDIVRKVKEWL